MQKRMIKTLITTIVVSSFIVTPVFAEPKDIQSIETQKQDVESQAADVNSQLVALLVSFNALQQDMGAQKERIVKSEADLQEAAQKEQEQYEAMKLRIQYMYESGDTSFLETIVSAKSYSDLVNKSEYVQKVHIYDRKMLKEYAETKEKVASIKQELEAGEAEMQAMSEELEGQKTNMEGTLSSMQAQIADFDGQLAAAKEQATAQLGTLTEETKKASEIPGQAAEKPSTGGGGTSKPTNPETPSKPSGGGTSKPANPGTPSKPSGGGSGGGSNTTPSNPGNASLGQQIANTACNYVGNPYVYGGTSLTNGADCSGFVQSVHKLLGIATPRTSGDQQYGGKAVSSSNNMLPGDIIVYSGHVAIYIGGGSIVHASNSKPYPAGGIKISSPWNYRTVLAIRRYW